MKKVIYPLMLMLCLTSCSEDLEQVNPNVVIYINFLHLQIRLQRVLPVLCSRDFILQYSEQTKS